MLFPRALPETWSPSCLIWGASPSFSLYLGFSISGGSTGLSPEREVSLSLPGRQSPQLCADHCLVPTLYFIFTFYVYIKNRSGLMPTQSYSQSGYIWCFLVVSHGTLSTLSKNVFYLI